MVYIFILKLISVIIAGLGIGMFLKFNVTHPYQLTKRQFKYCMTIVIVTLASISIFLLTDYV